VFEYNTAPTAAFLESDGFEQYTDENLKCRKFITDLSDLELLKFNVKSEKTSNLGTLHEGIKEVYNDPTYPVMVIHAHNPNMHFISIFHFNTLQKFHCYQ
jgi:hypothetical protein